MLALDLPADRKFETGQSVFVTEREAIRCGLIYNCTKQYGTNRYHMRMYPDPEDFDRYDEQDLTLVSGSDAQLSVARDLGVPMEFVVEEPAAEKPSRRRKAPPEIDQATLAKKLKDHNKKKRD